ncbi:hypothetical protein QZH41_002240 [Actinostola sp. cb2023]|nr:hypothetical protein QZH41_002240 [Actinostola sp. cb2023]
MQNVIQTLKHEHPEIVICFFRQDNAGCYHSSNTIIASPAIEASTGVKMERIDFSDPQGGKGAADRMAATAKSHIRLFINEGNDVTTAIQMKNALLSSGGIKGVRVAAIDNLDELNVEVPKIQDHGYKWLNGVTFSPGDFKSQYAKSLPVTTTPPEDQIPATHVPSSSPSSGVFPCPNEGCIRVFQRFSNLERHLSFDQCSKSIERHCLLDLAKIEYASLLQEGVGAIPVLESKLLAPDEIHSIAQEGWALRGSKKPYRFNDRQKEYLELKFNIGQVTGKKSQPEAVARDMRRAKGEDGK